MLGSFKQLLGLDNPRDNEFDDNFEFEENNEVVFEEKSEEKNEENSSSFFSKLTKKNSANVEKISSLENEMGNGTYQTIFLDPKTFSDCRKIVNYIKDDKIVTLNLEYLDDKTAVKLLNFLSGAMSVKEANYLVISKKVYTIIPKCMKVYYEGKKTLLPKIFTDFSTEGR